MLIPFSSGQAAQPLAARGGSPHQLVMLGFGHSSEPVAVTGQGLTPGAAGAYHFSIPIDCRLSTVAFSASNASPLSPTADSIYPCLFIAKALRGETAFTLVAASGTVADAPFDPGEVHAPYSVRAGLQAGLDISLSVGDRILVCAGITLAEGTVGDEAGSFLFGGSLLLV